VFVWAGKGCTGDEREMAKKVAGISPRGFTMIIEGQEKDDFWTLLGGKGEYSSTPRLVDNNEERPARLFQCSNASGAFIVNEIVEFSQGDLVTDDVFILDAYNNVYVWIGEDARPEEKTLSMDAAIEYIETDPSQRDPGTPIFVVKQGIEPPDFVGYFGVWNRDLWSDGKSYSELKAELGANNVQLERVSDKSSANGDVGFSDVAKYPYAELRSDNDEVPAGVDKGHREKHLSDEDFEKIFKTTYAKFVTMPAWKQQRLKKENHMW